MYTIAITPVAVTVTLITLTKSWYRESFKLTFGSYSTLQGLALA